MAKYKAFYASEDEIPQYARDNNLYVNRNGRWEFDHSEFEGLEDLTSPGLATNRDNLRHEKAAANSALTAEKLRADTAEAELRKVQKPGTKIIDSTEAKLLEQYQTLGAPKDLEKIKQEHTEYAAKLGSLEGEKELRKLCEEAKLNFEAVNDFISIKAKGAKLVVKDVKEKDAKGNETLVKKAFVSVEKDEGNGRFKTEESELKVYADKNLPKYMANAIFAIEDAADSKQTPTPSGVRLPALSGGKSTSEPTESDAKTHVATFNAQRNSRALPWDKREAAA